MSRNLTRRDFNNGTRTAAELPIGSVLRYNIGRPWPLIHVRGHVDDQIVVRTWRADKGWAYDTIPYWMLDNYDGQFYRVARVPRD